MPQNPKPNSDNTTNQTTNNPDSWSSPKGTAEKSFVRFDQDDLYPERIERLGQYLSDTTRGDMSNIDVRGGQANDFPVSPPGETTPTYTDQLSDAMEKAVRHFETLSEQTSFDPGVGQTADGTYGPGHSLLQDRAEHIVEESIDLGNVDSSSRWFGLGRQKMDPNRGGRDVHAAKSKGRIIDRPTENLSSAEPSGVTKFSNYGYKTGQKTSDSEPKFWDNYFDRLAMVGAKITLGATGHDLPSEGRSPGGAPMGIPKIGLIDNDDLLGNYSKHENRMIEPGETFKDLSGSNEYNRYEALQEEFKPTYMKPMSNETYGQMNSWNDPFESTGFPIVENQGLRIAIQLLEIWAMVVLRILITTSLLQIASYLLSVILQNIDPGQGDGPDGFLGVNWNRNYYPEDPQIIPGSAFFQGSSGFNHPATDVLTRGMDALNRASASAVAPGGAIALGVSQLVGPTLNSGAKIIENEYLNLTVSIQRDLNIYIPRHILSTMANETGYNSPGKVPGIHPLLKALDIYTAYMRAYTAGMGTIFTHIVAGDYGKSLSFWKTIFRTVVRSKAHWGTFIKSGNAFDALLRFMGKDDKIMKFTNYLAMIGDIGTAAGHAGNIAFPENKVPLHQVGNFPTLRTIGGRKRGSKTTSRLALTETPSLMLIPNNIATIKHNLKEYGVDENSTYADISGENSLWYDTKNKDIKKEIGNKYQSSTHNRFTPDQVRMVEDQLEGEHMPFYIHDLRTNEIISFHAFLTSLSDSYTGEWSAQKGFGRLEAAQIYGGGSRSIGLGFTMVAMNPEDFDEMYYKINKLTTLVYPQWSEGTLMDSGDSTFIQPFSQVPTASPLCRVRVGDLFTSNYSKVAMARMMGIGNENFKYTEPDGKPASPAEVEEEGKLSVDDKIKKERAIKWKPFLRALIKEGYNPPEVKEIREKYQDNPHQFKTQFHDRGDQSFSTVHVGPLNQFIKFEADNKNLYLSNSVAIPPSTGLSNMAPMLGAGGDPKGIASLFSAEANPILKSFHSSMGRGIAVAITGITFDWKLNSAPWELQAGNRAPRMCDVQLSIIPIHDITPGLDHQGINRAPIYKVGSKSKSLTGDVWYNEKEYGKLTEEIELQHRSYLRGEEEE